MHPGQEPGDWLVGGDELVEEIAVDDKKAPAVNRFVDERVLDLGAENFDADKAPHHGVVISGGVADFAAGRCFLEQREQSTLLAGLPTGCATSDPSIDYVADQVNVRGVYARKELTKLVYPTLGGTEV
jgi:hypothetical protein